MSWRRGPLYAAFAGTGIGVALPGAILPALLVKWQLRDGAAGRLFLMAWLGSSVGALAVRGSLRLRLTMGSVAIAAGCFGMGWCGGYAADAWVALYGLGLGMTMTSISLMRQQEAAAQSGVELVRLNLVWAAGACACPSLAVRALSAGTIKPLLFGLGGGFLIVSAWAAMQGEVLLKAAGGWSLSRIFLRVPPSLILTICLITGVEASAGGWLATYARRGGHGIVDTVAAPTCLWAGLLASRLFWSLRVSIPALRVVRGSLTLMSGAAALLLAGEASWTVLLAAILLGLGIGPVYPFVLDWTLRCDRGTAIFFLAGLGSAALPWLTGVASGLSGSLRVGLGVPVAATLAMLMTAWASPWDGLTNDQEGATAD